ncbi:hypothetical protein A9Q81_01385 [Gammaproteobacteria bacterium 42_54_T18]|nr:hypothetical protein A9Q81_01385 [Gammaproteobacteria bacterium 42_54_T18]
MTLLVSGCAIGPQYIDPKPAGSGMALVFFMNSYDTQGGFWGTDFLINNKKVVNIHMSGYSWVYLNEGYYTVGASNLNVGKKIEAGKKYYFAYRQHDFRSGAYSGSYKTELREVDPIKGGEYIKEYRYTPSDLEVLGNINAQRI